MAKKAISTGGYPMDLSQDMGSGAPQNPSITVGSVDTLKAGSQATVSISGSYPNMVLNFGIPAGSDGATPDKTTMNIGTIKTLNSGYQATAEITGTAPNYTLNLSIPAGADAKSPTLSIGKVETLAAGAKATATVSGAAPAFTIDLGIPQGAAGNNATNPTPLQFEYVSGSVVTAGKAVAIKFTKTYTAPPAVQPSTIWSGTQCFVAQATDITTTGCNVLVYQSRGTLILSGGPFENAAAGVQFKVFVIGS